MSRVYLAVPIIANRDLNKARLLSRIIEDTGHEIVSKWVKRIDPGFNVAAREIFERDIEGVKECNILVAEISDRSHGVGMEIMQAYIQRKKIICLFKKGVKVSRMILGLPEAHLIEYSVEHEMVEKLNEFLSLIS